MRVLTILILAISSIAFAQANSQTKNVVAPKNKPLTNNVKTKSKAKSFQMPNIETIGEAVVERISENTDRHNNYFPPWTEVKVTFFYLQKKPLEKKFVAQSKVTLVPLEVNVASFDWQIAKSEIIKARCDYHKLYNWVVELKPFTQREFFEIKPSPGRPEQFPFDVVVLYPAVKFARQIKKEQLTKQMLPNGTSLNTVKAAIDVTNDQKPDILLLKHCCDDATKATLCGYPCGKLFKQVNGKWELIEEYSPCKKGF